MSTIVKHDGTGKVTFYSPRQDTAKHVVDVTAQPWQLLPNTLQNPDLSAVAGLPQKWWKVEGGAVVPLPDSDRVAVERPLRLKAVAARTRELMEVFLHQGKPYASDPQLMAIWNHAALRKSALGYPLCLWPLDFSAPLVIGNAADLDAFTDSLTTHLRNVCDVTPQGGPLCHYDLCGAILTATTMAELDAVVDAR